MAMLVISVAVIAGHLLPGLDDSLAEDGIRNGLHLLVFAAFSAILFGYLTSSGFAEVTVVVSTIVAVATIGTLAELLQYVAGGLLDFSDIVRDISGAVLALAARSSWRWSGKAERGSSARTCCANRFRFIRCIDICTAVLLGIGHWSGPQFSPGYSRFRPLVEQVHLSPDQCRHQFD